MLLGLIHNASLLITLVVVYEAVRRLLGGQRHALGLASGLVFGVMGILVMMTPITFAPGVIYDGRSVVLTLAGLFGGPLAGGVAALICGSYRLYLGGEGALVGTAVVVEAALLGGAAHHLWQRNPRRIGWLPLLGLGVAVHAIMLALQLMLPGGAGLHVLRQVGLPVIIGFPLTFLLAAQVLLEGDRRRRDLATRERSAQQAEIQRKMLARTEAMAHVGSWEWEIATDRVTWSDELFRIFGLEPADEAPSFEVHQLAYLPESRARLVAAVQRCVEEGVPYDDLELQLARPDGTIRTCLVNGVAYRDEHGRITRLAGSLHDITEHTQAEAALAESRALLDNLSQLVPGVIYQYRLWPGGRSAFPYSSPGMRLIYEVSPDDVREDATPVFGRLHPDDAEEVSQAIVASAESLQTFLLEFRVILPEQGLRWRWCRAEPEALDDGSVLWHGIIMDVTELKLAEIEQERLRGQLIQAQKMESVGRLAGGVAHDFNNMLNVILGHAELALSDLTGKHPLRRHLELVVESAQRSADLTRQLLAFARKQTATPRVLELGETIASLLKMLGRLIGEDIELVWRPAADPTWISIDPAQVDQVLANLCVNARDAIGEGHGVITIQTDRVTIDAAEADRRVGPERGEYVVLAVSDDGCGMDPQTQEVIFEPFYTTKSPGKGTGLGLATVYGIVKQNAGFIDVDSEPGRGTTFRIYLPGHPAPAGEPAPAPAPAKPRGGTESILVVEDEEATLEITRVMLERLGYQVLAARKPADAIHLAADRGVRIDLVISDVVMPEMNGRDLVAQILTHHPGLAHIFMSGYTADIIAHQGVLDRGVDFLQKPFTSADLAAKVREVLDRPRPGDDRPERS